MDRETISALFFVLSREGTYNTESCLVEYLLVRAPNPEARRGMPDTAKPLKWRKGRDSNPRRPGRTSHALQACLFVRSSTLPRRNRPAAAVQAGGGGGGIRTHGPANASQRFSRPPRYDRSGTPPRAAPGADPPRPPAQGILPAGPHRRNPGPFVDAPAPSSYNESQSGGPRASRHLVRGVGRRWIRYGVSQVDGEAACAGSRADSPPRPCSWP